MRRPPLERFLSAFPECIMDEQDSLETVRAKMARIHPRDHAPETRIETFETAGVGCAWVSTPATDPSRIVFFVHGGAFAPTGLAECMAYAQTVANFCEARLLVPAYSLAPEVQFPNQLDELTAAYDAADPPTDRTIFSRELLHAVWRDVRSLDGRIVLGDAELPSDVEATA